MMLPGEQSCGCTSRSYCSTLTERLCSVAHSLEEEEEEIHYVRTASKGL